MITDAFQIHARESFIVLIVATPRVAAVIAVVLPADLTPIKRFIFWHIQAADLAMIRRRTRHGS